MFDTMTLTKAVGAVCGALLFLLLAAWAAEVLYHVDAKGEQAYVIDTGEEAVAEAPTDEGPDFATLMASADAAAGERSWSKCRACHALEEGRNGVGPYLHGVMGRDVATASGYNYSDALQAVEGVWTAEKMSAWLEDPRGFAPGNKMSFAGIRSAKERADLIAFMGENSPGWVLEVSAPAREEAAAPAEEAESTEQAAETPAAEETAAVTTEAQPGAAEGTPAATPTSIAAAFAQADPARGQAAFRQCAACHVADKEQNRVGPHLMGVLGRDIASVEGFAYSNALKGLEGAWTLEALGDWLENPRAYAPGNKMGFAGVKDMQARADIIAYIESLNN